MFNKRGQIETPKGRVMDEYTYSVVEFLQTPYPGNSKWVCVPSSWIKTRRETDNKVGVLYPDANESVIEKLVEKNQKIRASMNFYEYLGEVLYNTNEYKDAKIFIMIKHNKDSGNCSQVLNKCKDKKIPLNNGTPKNNLKRRHSACNTKNGQNVSTPQHIIPMNSKSLAFLKEVATLTAKLSEVINSYVASYNVSTLTSEDTQMGTSHMQDEESDSTSDETGNPQIPKRRASTFVLPPEYDETDTKWTVKYREPAHGLIELMPDSNVYVEASELGRCIHQSQNEMQLARALLIAVFKESALKTCSITGAKAHAHKNEFVRPALDREAKDAMLQFIRLYGERKGWEQMPERLLNACIRNKLTDIRKMTPQKIEKHRRSGVFASEVPSGL